MGKGDVANFITHNFFYTHPSLFNTRHIHTISLGRDYPPTSFCVIKQAYKNTYVCTYANICIFIIIVVLLILIIIAYIGVFVGMGIAAAILVCGIVATVVIRRWWCRRELWRDRRLVNKEVFRKVVVSSPGMYL